MHYTMQNLCEIREDRNGLYVCVRVDSQRYGHQEVLLDLDDFLRFRKEISRSLTLRSFLLPTEDGDDDYLALFARFKLNGREYLLDEWLTSERMVYRRIDGDTLNYRRSNLIFDEAELPTLGEDFLRDYLPGFLMDFLTDGPGRGYWFDVESLLHEFRIDEERLSKVPDSEKIWLQESEIRMGRAVTWSGVYDLLMDGLTPTNETVRKWLFGRAFPRLIYIPGDRWLA